MSLISDPVAPEPTDGSARHDDPGAGRLIAFALAIGVILEIGLRGGVTNAMIALAVVVIVRLLWTDQRLDVAKRGSVAAASRVPALFLGLRASPWLAWSNALAVSDACCVAVIHARPGSILDSTPAQILRRGASGLARGLAGLSIVTSVTSEGVDRPARRTSPRRSGPPSSSLCCSSLSPFSPPPTPSSPPS